MDAAVRQLDASTGVRVPLAEASTELPDAEAAPTDATHDTGRAEAGSVETGSPRVWTTRGPVQGELRGDTRRFLAIPYAEPPLGALRFAPPVPRAAWVAPRLANRAGARCPQLDDPIAHVFQGAIPEQSEDCLTLDVYAPAHPRDGGRPVLVFIHGGGFLTGGSFIYDGQKLSEAGDAVVVVIQYRLGVFGFLVHASLDAELGIPSGNMGLRDQQLALRWVRDNAAAFGGDPARVTLFGESAGAVGTCLHMFMPESRGLAQRFIIESGACVAGPAAPYPRSTNAAQGDKLVSDLCSGQSDVVACLRGLSGDQLVRWTKPDAVRDAITPFIKTELQAAEGYWPYVDGALIPDHPMRLLRAGKLVDAPFIAGSNLREQLITQYFGYPKIDSTLFMAFWTSLNFGDDAEVLLKHYTPDSDARANDAYIRMWSDQWFHCPTLRLMRGAAELQREAYLYDFAVAPGSHAQELDYVFDMSPPLISPMFPGVAPVPLLADVVAGVQGLWNSFAHDGKPAAQGVPVWAPFRNASPQSLQIQSPFALAAPPSAEDCQVWDPIYDEDEAAYGATP